jgi:5'(3')-deoxyribonucleotidase
MNNKPVVLLDCDGVLANFDKGVIEFINSRTNSNLKESDITTYKIFDKYGGPILEKEFYDFINEGGFCSHLEPYEEAIPAVIELQLISDLYIVTKPLWLSSWVLERTEWLSNKFNIPRNKIVYTAAKHLVNGDIFVDDNFDNIKNWKQANPNKIAVLWDMPYNKDDNAKKIGAFRLSNWDMLVNLTERLLP